MNVHLLLDINYIITRIIHFVATDYICLFSLWAQCLFWKKNRTRCKCFKNTECCSPLAFFLIDASVMRINLGCDVMTLPDWAPAALISLQSHWLTSIIRACYVILHDTVSVHIQSCMWALGFLSWHGCLTSPSQRQFSP